MKPGGVGALGNDTWPILATVVSAIGLATAVSRLLSSGAKEALRLISLLSGTLRMEPESRRESVAGRLSGADAEAFLRNYVKAAEAEETDRILRTSKVEVRGD